MVSGRQSAPASREPAQIDGDLGRPRKEDKGTEPRTSTGRGREGGRKGKGGREKHCQREMSETETERHRKHKRQRQDREKQRKSEIEMIDPGWMRRKDRKKLRELSIWRLMEVETRAKMVMPMWAGGQEEGNLQGLPSVNLLQSESQPRTLQKQGNGGWKRGRVPQPFGLPASQPMAQASRQLIDLLRRGQQ